MSEKHVLICAALYAAVAVLTFGHAAAHSSLREADGQALSGMMGAVLWPLYWSWEAWS